jgi:hypothetical protein
MLLQGVSTQGLESIGNALNNLLEIDFDFSLKFERLGEIDLLLTHTGIDGLGSRSVAFASFVDHGQSVHGLEDLGHMSVDFLRVGTVGQNIQKVVD